MVEIKEWLKSLVLIGFGFNHQPTSTYDIIIIMEKIKENEVIGEEKKKEKKHLPATPFCGGN